MKGLSSRMDAIENSSGGGLQQGGGQSRGYLPEHMRKSPWTQCCPSTGDQGGARSSPSGLHGLLLHEQQGRAGNNPLVLMVDEHTGDNYARMVKEKGLGSDGEMEWLVRDMSEELK